ncbi:MAG: hypothetical protein LBG81_04870, partial [Coriobacteriaceae bacterium]|nr:hypothetical protein [Coriobacteriaceae bacterium]
MALQSIRNPNVLLAGLGLAFGCCWVHLLAYSAAFAPLTAPDGGFLTEKLTSCAFYGGVVAGGLAIGIAGDRLLRLRRYLDACSGILMCLGAAAFGMAYKQVLFNQAALAGVGAFSGGLGFMWLIQAFCALFAHYESTRSAILVMMASLAAGMLLSFGMNMALGIPAQVFGGICLPLLACALMMAASHRMVSDSFDARTGTQEVRQSEMKAGTKAGRQPEIHAGSQSGTKAAGTKPEIKVSSQVGTKAGTKTGRKAPKALTKEERRYQLSLLLAACIGPLIIRSISYSGLWGEGRRDLSSNPVAALAVGMLSCGLFLLLAWFFLVKRSSLPLRVRYQAPFFVLVAG